MSDLQGTAVTVLLPSSGKQADSATTPGSTGRDEGNAGALPFSVQLSRAASDSRTRSGGSADATDRDSRPAQSIVQQEIPENGDATDQPALVGLPEAAASQKRTVEQKTVIIEDAVLPAHNGSVGTEHLEAEVLVAQTDLTELTIDSAGKQATEAGNASPGHEKHALADKGSEQEGVPLLAAQSPSSNAVELTPRAEVPFRTVDTVSEEPGASI
ncbi:MAG: hypothetical protein HKN42_11950, partial [Granulosicoccus sp.]|nr:hypothetical protein [Granulosicoccus sp.]